MRRFALYAIMLLFVGSGIFYGGYHTGNTALLAQLKQLSASAPMPVTAEKIVEVRPADKLDEVNNYLEQGWSIKSISTASYLQGTQSRVFHLVRHH